MKNDFNEKIVLVTGAARGLAKEVARKFLDANATVIITDIDDEAGDKALKELINLGRIIYLHMDITIEEEIENVINKIVSQFGKLDIAINNSPYMPPNILLDKYEEGQVRKTIDVDLIGVYNSMKYELKQMVKQKEGKIVNISSIAGLKGIKGLSIFSAAKHGIIGLTKSAALEYMDNNININAICPGIIETESFDEIKNKHKDDYNYYISLIPNKTLAKPEEIASAVLWLSSSDAKYCNGTILTIDGGVTI
ncbi:MAG TPA: SDR family oxidoreductase [Acholeplasmataceae bacterium]|nr:SDR family oxidoreductase [Acholeplasmataceae bacterium]